MSDADSAGPQGLVSVTDIPYRLLYDLQGLDGAMQSPFLSSLTLPHLYDSAQYLRQKSTSHRTLELLIWDAYRTPQTQTSLYERYIRELIATECLTYDEAFAQARAFVAPPTAVFPHGTGGAVDVTLLIDGEEAPMGTGFDDFVPHAASNWYHQTPPQTEADFTASANREMLRTAMETAGFVGLDSEWWHFEWGTKRWAEAVGMPVILSTVLAPP